MKLTHIEIKNYRSLFHDYDKNQSFEFDLGDGVNSIVGPNNVGKSNIFRALALALDPDFEFDRQRDMPANSIWAKPSVTLTFHVQKTGTPGREKTLLKRLREYEKAVRPGGKQSFADDGLVKLRATIEGGEESAGVRRRAFVTKGAGARDLSDDDPIAIKALRQFDDCLRFVLVRSGESLESLLQGRFRDVLQAILKAELSAEYEEAGRSRERYVEALQDGLLATLRTRLSQEINELFPEVEDVELEPNVRDLEDTLTGMQVRISDSAITDLADKGTGVRGGLIIAMLQHLAAASKRSMVFAVEEPESFLHPAAQEGLRDDIEELALRRDVSLLVTTHSPNVISRRSEAKLIAVAKSTSGRTYVRSTASGDEPLGVSLHGLFRSSLMVGFLERAARSVPDERGVLVVEGETDRSWLHLAAKRSGRLDLLDGLTVVAAGDGLESEAGGAALAAMQALVLQSTSEHPVSVLLDNDEHGRHSMELLAQVNNKTKQWKVGKRVLCYHSVFNKGNNKHFEYEAEDLWPDDLHEEFLQIPGNDTHLAEKVARPKPEGGYHYGYHSKAKPELAVFLEERVESHHCTLWIEMLEQVRKGLEI